MKFKSINNKKIIAIILSGFIIVNMVGCSKTENTLQENYQHYNQETVTENSEPQIEQDEPNINPVIKPDSNESVTSEPSINSTTNNNDNNNNNNNSSNNNVTEEYSSAEEYRSADEKAIETFNNLEEDIDNILNSETVNNAKDKAKGVFVTVVDFLFYDSEINGVTFDELTDSGKQKVLEIASRIDTKIENKFPNYKETISETAKEAFNKASELIKKGANNLKEFSKEKLGEENYNAIVDVKDEIVEYTKEAIDIIGDFGSNIFNKGKEYIKEWYENFRN